MAVEIGEAYVSIIPSARGFSGHLSNLIGPGMASAGSSAGNEAGSSFIGSFVSHLGRIAALVAGAFAAAGIAKAVEEAFSTTAKFETTQVAFEGLLGSADEAKRRLAELQDFAAATPFEFPELAEASKKLLAVGYDADQIIPIMGTLGDAAAAVGAKGYDINLVVRALGQIKGKGRVMREEINQIAEALPGFNPMKALAEQTGISLQALEDNISKPGGLLKAFGITGDQAADLIIKGMTGIRGASGAMDRQMKTVSGTISTLKDELRQAAIATLLPFFPDIAKVISGTVIPAVQHLGEILPGIVGRWVHDFVVMVTQIQTFIDAFRGLRRVEDDATWFAEFGRRVRADWETVKAVFNEIVTSVTTFIGAFKGAAGQQDDATFFANLGRAARDLYEDIKKVIDFVETNKDVFLAISVGALAGAGSFIAYSGAALGVASALEKIAAAKALLAGGNALSGLLGTLGPLAAAAGPWGLLVAAIVAVIAGIVVLYLKWKPFHDLVNNTASMIAGAAVVAFHALATAFTAVKDALVTAFNAVSAAASTVASAVMTALQPIIDWITAHLFPAIASVAVFFAVLFQQIYAAVSGTISAIMTVITPWLQNMLDVMQIGFTAIWGAVQLVWTQITTAFQVAIDILTPIWSFFWDQIKAVVELSFNLVVTTVTTVLDLIKGVFSAATAILRGDWQGLWDAIKSIAETLFNAAKDTISNTLDTIKNLFSNTLGAIPEIVRGIANGVEDAIGGIISALRTAADTIGGLVGRIKDAISSIPGAGVVGNIIGALPFGAAGGIVRKPTLMVIGEAGPEAVVPLGMFGAGGTLPPLRSYVAHAPPTSDNGGSYAPVVNIYAPLGVDRKEVVAAVAAGLRSHDAARRGS